MNIGILGAGNVGSGLAARLVEDGHDVVLAASGPASTRLAEAVARSGARAGTAVEAAGAEVLVLAVPFAAVGQALTPEVAAAARGAVVVDATNPLTADFMGLTLGHTTSAGEEVARLLPGSRVVKAFNTVFAATLAEPVLGGQRQLLPVAADDDAAKALVLDLGRRLGFDAVDAGPLSNARYLEPAVELLIQLAYGQGLGPGIGLTLARAA